MESVPHSIRTASYEGRRHARITRSMKQLPDGHLRILTELRYMLADGESAVISIATLARRVGRSQGYVSVVVRQLAGETVTHTIGGQPVHYYGYPTPFIVRRWEEAAGAFVTTMLPPPELRRRPTPPESPASEATPSRLGDAAGDHGDDPHPDSTASASVCEESPQMGDHGDDPPILLDSCHEQQQRSAPDSQQAADRDRPVEIWSDRTWQAMLAGSPGYTKAAFYADRAALLNRPGYDLGVIVEARRNGLPIWSREDLDHARRRTTPPAGLGDDDAGVRERHTPGADSCRRSARSGRAGAPQPGSPAARRAAGVAQPPLDIDDITTLPFLDLAALGLSL